FPPTADATRWACSSSEPTRSTDALVRGGAFAPPRLFMDRRFCVFSDFFVFRCIPIFYLV
ncbi:MAG: hypothetical protein IIZ96_01690, partial [Oscillospiraceae bacterium]|nr:hypothetical protein [Oscillospiraceae bacterium]